MAALILASFLNGEKSVVLNYDPATHTWISLVGINDARSDSMTVWVSFNGTIFSQLVPPSSSRTININRSYTDIQRTSAGMNVSGLDGYGIY